MDLSAGDRADRSERSYSEILFGIEEITDRLIEAAKRRDVSELDRLVESRQMLLDEVSLSSPRFSSISVEVRALQSRVIEKQAECERLMVRGVEDCRSDLLAMRKGGQARSLYNKPAAITEHPRFLDKRL